MYIADIYKYVTIKRYDIDYLQIYIHKYINNEYYSFKHILNTVLYLYIILVNISRIYVKFMRFILCVFTWLIIRDLA